MSKKNANHFRLAKLPYHIKLAILGVGASSPALAQSDVATENDEVPVDAFDEIIVTGVRGSLMSSQLLKQNSDAFVDAVTAEDIGALPDRSVTEVMQRIPGVSISRFAGEDDPDHFSAEGSGTIIRGLTFVRSELNGRDVFTADSGQALGFSSVSPELMQSVQVFKTQSADLIEGGIGGSVNLVTRKPFDSPGAYYGFSAESNYSDLREEWTPGFSGLASGRWPLADGGEFGALISLAYSELQGRSDGTLVADWLDRGTGQFIPAGAGIRTSRYDRDRRGVAGALQWASADESVEATFQFFNSTYDNSWGENAIEPSIDDSPGIVPRSGTSFTFGPTGLFESGVISQSVGWRSNEPTHPLNGVRQLALLREQANESSTDDYSLNLSWQISDRLRSSFDVQRVESDVRVDDYTVHGAFFADVALDMTTDIPQVTYLIPEDAANQTDYFSDPQTYYLRSIMDHIEDNTGDETAVRADFELDFSGDSFVDSVQFGARFAEREQQVRFTVYNWGNVSATWNQPWLYSNPNNPGAFTGFEFDNYMRGDAPGISGVPFYSGELTPDALRDLAALSGQAGWVPVADRGGVVAGTPFLPTEVYNTDQQTTAAYVRFNFSGDMANGVSFDGNFGLRYVETDQATDGFINFPDFNTFLGSAPDLATRCTPVMGQTLPGFCSVDAATQASFIAWADGSGSPLADSYSYSNVLPSLTVKFGLDDTKIIRFGASQAISRPDFGLLKSFYTVNGFTDDPVTGAWLGPQAQTSNVRLDPIESTQFDLSFEWYFDEVGSLTISGFHKTLENYIVPSNFTRAFENNGESFDINTQGVANSEGDGKVKGVEIAYQQTFEMLPGFMRHFGVQTNYTYLSANGLPIEQPKSNEPTGGQTGATTIDVSGLSLPGLSEDTFNFTAFWENDTISARLAYNYRSEFTLTTRDVIFPFTPIVHAPTGTLDGSFFWNVTPEMQVGLQAVNLTDEVTETRAVYDQDLNQAARSYFKLDRRFALIFRGSF